MKPIFAVDVGGVLASKQHDGTAIENSFAACNIIREKFKLIVVSQCGTKRAEQTKIWLAAQGFTSLFDDLIFIGFKEKNKNRVLTEINAKYFIDDRAKHIVPSLELPNLSLVFHYNAEVSAIPTPHNKYVMIDDWFKVSYFATVDHHQTRKA